MAGSRNQHCANLYRHTFVSYWLDSPKIDQLLQPGKPIRY